MGNRKDIGKLFNERFKNFEQAPGADLWDTIASELDQKSDRKIAPLWFYFGGFLIVGMLTGLLYWHPWSTTNTTDPKEQSFVLNQETVGNKETQVVSSSNQKDIKNATITNNTSPEEITDTITNTKETSSYTTNTSNQLVSAKDNTSLSSENTLSEKSQAVVTNASKNTNNSYNNTTSNSSKNSITSSTSLYNNKKTTSIAAVLNTLVSTSQKLRDKKELEAKTAYQTKVKEDLVNAIIVQKEENKIALQRWQDSIQSLSASKKTNLAVISKEEEKTPKLPKTEEERKNDRKESVSYKFAISPYTSLLNYGSLTKGSSIDNRLVDNPRDAIRTVGYGVRADYKFSEKSSIRFGVGIAPLQYRTDDFQVLVTNNNNVNIFQLSGIDPQNLNQGNGGIETSPEVLAFFNSNDVVSIEQNITYVEVPVDYQYRFLNKRVSMSFNGGMSLFVLTNNRVFATARNGENIFIGRETSLKDLSLALNFGLGTYYNFSKNWRFDLEPAFKYQLNPYTDNIGNFRPYYFGLQFGMSYKF